MGDRKEGGMSMDEEELGNKVREIAAKYSSTNEWDLDRNMLYLMAMMVLRLEEIGYELAALNAKVKNWEVEP